MMKKFITLIFFFLTASVVFSVNWPLEEVVIKHSFGESLGNHFNQGLILGGDSRDVKAIEDGKVIFLHHEEIDLSGLPSGLGNFVILEHDRGLVSLYANLDDRELLVEDSVLEGDVIGRMGQSGDASGIQLYLEVVDKEVNRMVNPFLLLPPLNDTITPVIEEVIYKNGQSYRLSEINSIPSGEGDLFVKLYDPSQYYRFFRPLAPFRINVFANGEELFYQSFESIESRQGQLKLVSQQWQRNFEELYAGANLYQLGHHTFSSGETILEVIVSDYQGNTVSEMYRIKIP